MQLTKDHKLERLDTRNIALFRRIPNKKNRNKERWEPIRFFSNWEMALRDALEHVTLGQIEGAGACSGLVREFSEARKDIHRIAKKLAIEIEAGGSDKQAPAATRALGKDESDNVTAPPPGNRRLHA